MENDLHRPVTRFGGSRPDLDAGAVLSDPDAAIGSSARANRFESPTVQTISLCCEISAYAPDSPDRDDWPLI